MNVRDKHIIKLIYRRIIEKDPTAEVILYGSRARGTQNKESDWELLILLEDGDVDRRTVQNFRHHLFDLELETGEPVSVFVYSKDE